MSQFPTSLNHQVLAPLRAVLGDVLAGVMYAVVPGELLPDWAADPCLCIGFGPALSFRSGRTLSFSSTEGSAWPDRFTISTSLEPWRPNDAVMLVPASGALWSRDAIGQSLSAVSVHGWARSPHLVRLTFGTSTLLIINGTSEHLGDTDDVLLPTAAPLVLPTPQEVLWASSPGA